MIDPNWPCCLVSLSDSQDFIIQSSKDLVIDLIFVFINVFL